jgi:hypothetical protein
VYDAFSCEKKGREMQDNYLIADASRSEIDVGKSGVLMMLNSLTEKHGGIEVPVRVRFLFHGDDFGPFFYKLADAMVDYDEREKVEKEKG